VIWPSPESWFIDEPLSDRSDRVDIRYIWKSRSEFLSNVSTRISVYYIDYLSANREFDHIKPALMMQNKAWPYLILQMMRAVPQIMTNSTDNEILIWFITDSKIKLTEEDLIVKRTNRTFMFQILSCLCLRLHLLLLVITLHRHAELTA